jgi:hypothetical protein
MMQIPSNEPLQEIGVAVQERRFAVANIIISLKCMVFTFLPKTTDFVGHLVP